MDYHGSIRRPCVALGIFSPGVAASQAFEESCGRFIAGAGLLNPPDCTNIGTLRAVNFNDRKFLLSFFHVKNWNASFLINLCLENNLLIPLALLNNTAFPALPVQA